VAFGLVSTHLATLSSFMQEKYKRRKQKKYAPHVLVRRPSARRLVLSYGQSIHI
jgi:hypothetical protein